MLFLTYHFIPLSHIYVLDFEPDDKFLLSGSADETVMVWSLEGLFESDPEEKSLPSLGPIFDARFRQIYRSQVHKKIIYFNYDLANCMQASPACLQCPWPNCTTYTFWQQRSHWQKDFFFQTPTVFKTTHPLRKDIFIT